MTGVGSCAVGCEVYVSFDYVADRDYSGEMCIFACCFFFSSRRRHTRSLCDWSSDVCSSDLLSCPFFVAAAPPLFLLPICRCGSALLFVLPISRCGSAPASYTAQFSLRQRPCILYCPFLAAAAPRFVFCPFLVGDRKSVV